MTGVRQFVQHTVRLGCCHAAANRNTTCATLVLYLAFRLGIRNGMPSSGELLADDILHLRHLRVEDTFRVLYSYAEPLFT